jgi:VWA domain-containing protein
MDKENLGPAERILQSVLTYTDHLVHNRPGVVVADARFAVGVRWDYATYKAEGDPVNIDRKVKVVYRLVKEGTTSTKTNRIRAGILAANGLDVVDHAGRTVGQWRPAGIFPEVAAWMYKQVAEVWKIDNEFAARWASYQYGQKHRDLKVILAAFMLVQSRKGEPVFEGGKVVFADDDYRDVGEAMMLLYKKDGNDLNAKLLLRIREVLEIPAVAEINRQLGFTRSARTAPLGRWPKTVSKWLTYRERNPKLLGGLVSGGMRTSVIALAAAVGYKPQSPAFFQTLRWKQKQGKDGRRMIAIGEAVSAAESWVGLTEEQICNKIVKTTPSWKKITSMVPPTVGITRAIMACAIEHRCLSKKDLIIATPTIEELGLMDVQDVKDRWHAAVRDADDMRAANIATRVKSKAVKVALEGAADSALKKATEEVMKDMRVYVMVDRSGSMENAIQAAIRLLTRLLPAFPEDKIHVAHFNTMGQVVSFKSRTAAGVAQAFRGVTGTGGTDYGAGVRVLQGYKPTDEEDTLFIFVGDQQAALFPSAVRSSGLRPMAFGFVYVAGIDRTNYKAVELTAQELNIPCFSINEETFADTYAVPRTIRALVSATPVGRKVDQVERARVTLAEIILKTDILAKPVWAA